MATNNTKFGKGYKARRYTVQAVYWAVLILLAIILMLPYLYMVLRSLMTGAQVAKSQPIDFFPHPFSLEGYKNIFQSGAGYGKALLRTLGIVGFNIIFVPLSSSFVAYGFAKLEFIGKKFLFAVMLATIMIPGAVMQIPLFVMFGKLHWLNTIKPLTLPNMLGGGAMNIFLTRQYMRGLNRHMEEAAKLDGANVFQRFFEITLPLCYPILIYIVVGTFNGSWGDFYGPLIYMSKTGHETFAYLVFKQATNAYISPFTENARMAAGVFMSAVPLLLFIVFQKYLIDAVVISGVKG